MSRTSGGANQAENPNLISSRDLFDFMLFITLLPILSLQGSIELIQIPVFKKRVDNSAEKKKPKNMGRELQKKKNRSSLHKIKHKPKSKKLNIRGNPIVARNW